MPGYNNNQDSFEIEEYYPKVEQPKLVVPTKQNAINFLLVFANTLIFFFSYQNIGGLRSYSELVKKYPTLLSPYEDGLVFTWVGILAFECLFAIAQITPWCCNSEVIDTISKWWLIAGLCQIAWVLVVSFDFMFIGGCILVAILLSLMWMILTVDSYPWGSPVSFFFLRVPFSLHAGWVLFALALQMSMAAEKGGGLMDGFTPGLKIGLAITTLGFMCTIMTLFAIATARPDPFFCGMVAWACGCIAYRHHERLLVHDYENDSFEYPFVVVLGFMYVAAGCAFLCSCCAVLAFFLRFFARCCIKRQGEEIIVVDES